MAGNLTFRLFQPDDIAGVLQLWEESSGWGGITEEQFYKWYVDTPYGECLIAVAVDEKNCIVGQEVFTPSKIYVSGAERKALRFSAPILAKEFSGKLGSDAHPTVEMFKVAVRAAVKSGYSVVYAFPARAWLRFTPLFVLPELNGEEGLTAQFDCYSFSTKAIVNDSIKAENDFEASLATEFNEEYNELWQSAKKEFPINCAIVRNSDWLKWKLGSHFVLEVHRIDSKKLIGYAAIKKGSGLLVDALARTQKDLETTLITAIEFLCHNDLANQAKPEEIKVMKTEALASVIQKLGFKREKFKFAFWCYSIDETVPIQSLEPSRWYLMPKD